jgi:DnaJ-class molecular chaperone
MEFKDYYKTLGLTKKATNAEIKQAYRKFARKYHPDVNQGNTRAEAKFKEIGEAYEVLGSPDNRRKYDDLGANWRMYEQATPGSQGHPFTGGNWKVDFQGPNTPHNIFDGESFSDFFNAFFSGQAGPSMHDTTHRRRSQPQQPASEQTIGLTLEEAFHGATRRINFLEQGQTQSVEVRIPPGINEGAKIRVAGLSQKPNLPKRSTELFLRTHLHKHKRFTRKGNNLYLTIEIPLTTAILGGTVNFNNVNSRSLQLTIPAGTQVGQVFRLKEKGMPILRKKTQRGDLYVTVTITMPHTLTPEQRKHYEALAHLDDS